MFNNSFTPKTNAQLQPEFQLQPSTTKSSKPKLNDRKTESSKNVQVDFGSFGAKPLTSSKHHRTVSKHESQVIPTTNISGLTTAELRYQSGKHAT